MQLSNAIRQRLISVSKDYGISLKSACKKSGVSYSTLISFMVGKTKIIKLTTLYKVCYGIGIELVDFFDDKIFSEIVDEHEKDLEKNMKQKNKK